MKSKHGFTLIEFILVVIILALLNTFALPKITSVSDDARLATMKGMQATLLAATDLTHAKIELNPNNFTANGNRFILDTGERFLVRGRYPDGRWNNSFSRIVNMEDVTNNTDTLCDVETSWCARNRGTAWFRNTLNIDGEGRGFIIYPNGHDHDESACYLYYYNPNSGSLTGTGDKPFSGIVSDDC